MSKWFPYNNISSDFRIKFHVFGFPHSGGGATIFKEWNDYLPDWIEFVPVQLSGRETRIHEDFVSDMDTLSTEITEAIVESQLSPVCLFGHSLGGVVAFDVARKLELLNIPIIRLFISACSFPSRENRQSTFHQLEDKDLLTSLRSYKGTPSKILENQELLNFVLPRIRADFKIFETFILENALTQNFPISLFAGKSDDIAQIDKMKEWQQVSCSPISLNVVKGDHFFHMSLGKEICEYMAYYLEKNESNNIVNFQSLLLLSSQGFIV